jgi:hypothetical protein
MHAIDLPTLDVLDTVVGIGSRQRTGTGSFNSTGEPS